MSIISRPLTVADAPAIVDILNGLEAAEPADMLFDVEEITDLLTGPSTDLPAGTIGLARDGVLLAAGALRISPVSDVWKAVLLGGVRTSEHRRGLGHRLIDELTVAAGTLRDQDAPGRPGELRIFLPQGRDSTAALARAAGYRPWRYYFDMRIDLADDPGESAIPGLRVLPWSPEFSESTRLARNATFADHYGSVAMDPAHWRHAFDDAAGSRPAVSRIAVDGTEVVAFVLVKEFPAETERNGFRTAYIAWVGTLARLRGRGVASRLLRTTLHALREDGYAAADLSVDTDSLTNAVRLYERIGFRPLRRNTLAGRRF